MNDDTLTAKAYIALRRLIYNGDMAIGKVYSEQWCADMLRMSRTPVREALKQLQGENVIVSYPKRGLMIKPLEAMEISDIVKTRSAMESYSACCLASDYTLPEARECIKKLQDSLIRCEKRYADSLFLMNEDIFFHDQITGYVHSPMFDKLSDTLRFRSYQFVYLNDFGDDSEYNAALSKATHAHKEILQAIIEGDKYGAYESVLAHLADTKAYLFEKILPNIERNL